jgi:PiT family inorganic phosphate transporter
MGAGNTGHVGINWSVVKNIVIAWVLTLPICAIIAGICLQLAKLFM